MDRLSIPLEGLYTDSLSYVYMDQGGRLVKKEVIIGLSNDEAIMIEHGLTASDEIYLTEPANPEELSLVKLDPKIKKEIKRKQEEEKKARQAEMMKKMKDVKDEKISSDGGNGGGGFIIFN